MRLGLALIDYCKVVGADGLEGEIETVVHHDLVEIDNGTLLVNEKRLLKTGNFAYGHATLDNKVDFLTLVHG